MRIFALHFNPPPKAKPPAAIFAKTAIFAKGEGFNNIFDSFCYEPANVYERRMGSLYLVGELLNPLPQNSRLLNNLAQVIKGKYYGFPLKTPEQSFKECLKKANEFLSEEVKKDNVSWLGNLSFAVLAVKKFSLEFTKIADIKILLLRGRTITDVGKNLEYGGIEPYPLKVFTSIVSGNLAAADRIMVLTKEVFPLFSEAVNQPLSRPKTTTAKEPFSAESLLTAIANQPFLDGKKIKGILKVKEKALREAAGICLIIDLSETPPANEPRLFIFEKEAEKFSIRLVFASMAKTTLKIGLSLKNGLADIAIKLKAVFRSLWLALSRLTVPKFNFPKLFISGSTAFGRIRDYSRYFISRFLTIKNWLKTAFLSSVGQKTSVKIELDIHQPTRLLVKQISGTSRPKRLAGVGPEQFLKRLSAIRKKLFLVALLILLLFVGFFIFQGEKRQQLKNQKSILNDARLKTDQVKALMALGDEKKAATLLKEAWNEITPFAIEKGPLANELLSLKEEVEKQLKTINKLETIEAPEFLLEFNQADFIPQKMVFSGGNLYLFSPFAKNLLKIDPQSKSQKFYSLPFEDAAGISLAADLESGLALFLRPNKLIIFKNEEFAPSLSLKPPYADFNFSGLSSFSGNLYFFEEKANKIIKYAYDQGSGYRLSEIWAIDEELSQASAGAGSLAVNGLVWVLNQDNTVSRYRHGNYYQAVSLDFFPLPKKIYKILIPPNSSYLYLLEPGQKRVIILEKSGAVFRQCQSPAFDNLKDFSISKDGKTIYLLNGLKIYKIKL